MTTSRTAGFDASIANMFGTKPNCLPTVPRALSASAVMSSEAGVVRRDMADQPPVGVCMDFLGCLAHS
ncbi:Uncharacterised protein [Mycobacteroides abscessus subsp. abscessus]|nr:Uncharacterised protein [Mycobacteroides abscessus subsp. abscessus]